MFKGLDKIGKKITGKRSISGIMDEWIIYFQRISEFIREKSAFVIVANPEAIVVKHVLRLIRTHAEYAIPVHGIVINRVLNGQTAGSFKELKEAQEKHMQELHRISQGMPVAIITFSTLEIKGWDTLKNLGENLAEVWDYRGFF